MLVRCHYLLLKWQNASFIHKASLFPNCKRNAQDHNRKQPTKTTLDNSEASLVNLLDYKDGQWDISEVWCTTEYLARIFLLFFNWVGLTFLKTRRWLTLYCWARTRQLLLSHKNTPTNAEHNPLMQSMIVSSYFSCEFKLLHCARCTVNPNASLLSPMHKHFGTGIENVHWLDAWTRCTQYLYTKRKMF